MIGLNSTGQARGSRTDSQKLGLAYGWNTAIYGTRRRKRQKEASMEISKAILTNHWAGPNCDKTGAV